MPIYAYRCASCGHAKDVLQKLSDDALTVCPACGAEAFSKQLTAAGFQLKGSGWYVTDFRDGQAGKKDAVKTDAEAKPADKAADKSDAAKPDAKPADAAAPAPAAAAPTAAAAPPAPAPAKAPAPPSSNGS